MSFSLAAAHSISNEIQFYFWWTLIRDNWVQVKSVVHTTAAWVKLWKFMRKNVQIWEFSSLFAYLLSCLVRAPSVCFNELMCHLVSDVIFGALDIGWEGRHSFHVPLHLRLFGCRTIICRTHDRKTRAFSDSTQNKYDLRAQYDGCKFFRLNLYSALHAYVGLHFEINWCERKSDNKAEFW